MQHPNEIREFKLPIKGLPEKWLIPTTRYRGSKRKILPWIWEELKQLQFNSALDLFGGTSVVSIMLKRMGKEVTYNDYLKFNEVTGKAFITNKKTVFTEADYDFITTKHKKISYDDFIERTFEGYYYTNSENRWLDMVVQNIGRLEKLYSGKKLEEKKALAFWALGQACLIKRPFNLFHRKNLYLRTNEVERNFGNKTTWEQPFPLVLKRFLFEANQAVFSNKKENHVIRKDAQKVKQNDFDLVYIDPPYFFEGQSDVDYHNMYHFLDGLVDYQNWASIIDWDTINLRLNGKRMVWPDNSPTKLTAIFEGLIKEFQESTIVLSHKSGSMVSVGDIENMLADVGKNVYKRMKRYNYALSKKNGKPRENIEWLIIGAYPEQLK